MDLTLADTDVHDVQSNQGVVGFEVTNRSIGQPSEHISSWNVHLESSSQSVFTSTDTPSMLSPTLVYPIDGDEARHRGSRPPLAFGTINFNASVESFLSHLFTHSWRIPTAYTISNLCAYIDRTPTAHITLSIWCKELTGVPHEFLLLQVEGPQTKRFWLRIERRPRRNATLARLMSSRSPSDDTAELSTSLHSLFKSKSEVIVETNFRDPPSLHNLSILLCILGEESPTYKLWPQNCFFFCSIIYEHLFSIGRGENTSGVPSKLSMSLAPHVRATINRRVKDTRSNLLPSRSEPFPSLLPRELLKRADVQPNIRLLTSSNWNELSALVMDLPRAVHAAYDSSREGAPLSCLPGTRVGILTEILSWLEKVDSSAPSIYWLHGIAGTGKSVIAKTIAERAAGKGMLGASFFFSRSDRPLRDPSLVFPTLAFQLAQSDDTFKNVIGNALKQDASIMYKRLLPQLQGLILGPLLKIDRNTRTTLIVLDSLDECEESGAGEILRLLVSLASRIPFLRILVTSRPEPRISSVFDETMARAKVVLHDLDSSVVQEDIHRYIRHGLTEIPKRLGLRMRTDRITDEEMHLLIKRAGRSFAHAAVALRFIADDRVRDPPRLLRMILDTQTTQEAGPTPHWILDKLYECILRNLPDPCQGVILERFQVIVGSIVVLREPLPLYSLAKFVGYETDIVHGSLHHLRSAIIPPLNVQEAPRIYDRSFVDFITDASRCSMDGFVITVPKQERGHALRCFDLMARFLRRNIGAISDPSVPNSGVNGLEEILRNALPAEAQYACRYWASHVSCAEHGDVAVMQALEMFSMRMVLWWFEAMSLIGSISIAAGSINAVLRWAMSSGCPTAVLTILSDAHRFILAHGEIIGAYALHVYHSALPFTPHDTTLYKTYSHEEMQSVTVLQGVESRWPLCLSTLIDHSDWVNCVAFSPDGSRLASCSNDYTVRLWDAESGSRIVSLEGHSGVVKCIAFSPDGLRLASCSDDHTVRLWDAVLGAHIVTLDGHSGGVKSVAFSPNGSQLASCSDDGAVRWWDATSGVPIATLQCHADEINSIAFSPNGLRLASCSHDRTVQLWHAAVPTHIATLGGHSGRVRSIAFSPNGLWLASCSDDCTIRLWNALSGVPIVTLEGHSDWVNSIAFSPSGLQLASCSYDRTVRMWDVPSGAHIGTLEGHSDWVKSISFSPDGLRLASCSDDGGVRLWDTALAWHAVTLECHSSRVKSIALSPDRWRLASCSDDRTVKLWDLISGAQIMTLEGHSDWVNSIVFSPDGLRLASCSDDGTVRLWDAMSGMHIMTLGDHHAWVNSLAFSPDGSQLASGCHDGTVRLWDALSGAHNATLKGHSKSVNSVTFSLDGLRLASCSEDREVRLWDTVSRTIIAQLNPTNDALFAEFSIDSESRMVRTRTTGLVPRVQFVDRWIEISRAQDSRFERICRVPASYTPTTQIQVSGLRISVGCADGRILILSTIGLIV